MSHVLLASSVLGSAQATVVFSSIPSTYRDLMIVVNAQSNSGSGTTSLNIRFNGDSTGTNYVGENLGGNGTNGFANGGMQNYVGSAADADFSLTTINVFEYAQSKHKMVISRSGNKDINVTLNSVRWTNTTAINEVTLLPSAGSFRANSQFYLYGIAS